MRHRFTLLLLIATLITNASCTQAQPAGAAQYAGNQGSIAATARQHWVDSVYSHLSEDERIGQLFMLAAYSGGPNENSAEMERMIRANRAGGLIFMQGTAEKQAELTNRFQAAAKVPLLIAMDAEWGLGMRLEGIKNLPRQMMLGATRDTGLARELGATIATQCRRLGVHIDFAPDVDVNNNPENPVINTRSFGENKYWVARLGIAYMNGLQQNGVMACAKHFPGHGDVSVDSHKDLPVINKSLTQLDSLEFYPFRELIKAGVQSVMIAHLSVPALETGAHVPTTLSKNTVTNVLKRRLGFNGLIFTDALNMQGVAKYFTAGEADVRAFEAGCDVLLFSQDVPVATAKIKEAVKSGRVPAQELERRVKKLIAAKWDAGLNTFTPINPANIRADINAQTAAFNARVAEKAITVVRRTDKIFPFTKGMHVLYVGVNGKLDAAAEANLRASVGDLKMGTANLPDLDRKDVDAIVIGIHGLSFYPANNYGLSAASIAFLKSAAQKQNVIIAVMGNAYAIKYACNARNILCGYEDNEWTNAALVKALTGAVQPSGTLPVTPPCLK